MEHTQDCPGPHPETGRCLCALVRMCDEHGLPREFRIDFDLYWLPDGDGPFTWDGRSVTAQEIL